IDFGEAVVSRTARPSTMLSRRLRMAASPLGTAATPAMPPGVAKYVAHENAGSASPSLAIAAQAPITTPNEPRAAISAVTTKAILKTNSRTPECVISTCRASCESCPTQDRRANTNRAPTTSSDDGSYAQRYSNNCRGRFHQRSGDEYAESGLACASRSVHYRRDVGWLLPAEILAEGFDRS